MPGVSMTPRQRRKRRTDRRNLGYVRQGQLRDKPGRGEDDLEAGIAMLGLPYERQARIGPYFADFLIKPYRLVVEVDGREHMRPGYDATRDAWMVGKGYRVVRLAAEYARKSPRNAALTVLDALAPDELAGYKTLRAADLTKIQEHTET